MGVSRWSETRTVKVLWNDMEYTAQIMIFWYNEPNYGADLDGNRGISKDFIEEIEVLSVHDVYGTPIDPVPEHLSEEICDIDG